MTERNSLEANAECVLCTPVQTHGAGNSQGEIKCERRAEQPELEEGGGGGERLSKPQTEPFGFFFFKKIKQNPPSTNLGLDSLTEVPLVLPDHLTAGFEGPRLT